MEEFTAPSHPELVEIFTQKYGKPPENQAWGDYVAAKVLAAAMNEVESTDTAALLEHFGKEPKLAILKGREGYFRDWDHQLMQEMYTMTARPVDEVQNEWDLMVLGPAVPPAATRPASTPGPTSCSPASRRRAAAP